LSKQELHENPLVPHQKLRDLYTAMVEARLLDEHIATLQRKQKSRDRLESIHGQEACRVSTAIELKPGDLISDTHSASTMSLLFGAKPETLLRHLIPSDTDKRSKLSASAKESLDKLQLPWVEDVSDRLKMALGVALAFKTLKQPNLVVAYIHGREVPKGTWNQVLALASKLTLPIIFVVLPEAQRKKKEKKDRASNLSAKARAAGLPGIPVDARDAVALYRVSQESIGRARGGDGAVLIDCLSGSAADPLNAGAGDPLLYMKKFLIGRQVCTEAWANHAGDALRKKIGTFKASAK
jgi:TPP-dependent pyruvate/acetoin dehydrogenase alpha subunit